MMILKVEIEKRKREDFDDTMNLCMDNKNGNMNIKMMKFHGIHYFMMIHGRDQQNELKKVCIYVSMFLCNFINRIICARIFYFIFYILYFIFFFLSSFIRTSIKTNAIKTNATKTNFT